MKTTEDILIENQLQPSLDMVTFDQAKELHKPNSRRGRLSAQLVDMADQHAPTNVNPRSIGGDRVGTCHLKTTTISPGCPHLEITGGFDTE